MTRCHSLITLLLGVGSLFGTAGAGESAIDRHLRTFSRTLETPGPVIPLEEIPESLPGLWKVSLCIDAPKHAWIRFENVDDGRVVTLSRFSKGSGEWKHPRTDKLIREKRPVSSVVMNYELPYEWRVRTGKYAMLSVIVKNPKLVLGRNDGVGHGQVINNCATYTRDAWQHYSGEYYPFPRLHTPIELRAAVLSAHPEILKPRESRAMRTPEPRVAADPIQRTGSLLSGD